MSKSSDSFSVLGLFTLSRQNAHSVLDRMAKTEPDALKRFKESPSTFAEAMPEFQAPKKTLKDAQR